MNEIRVTLRGNAATEPKQVRFPDGNTLTSFRLASTARRYDGQTQEWVDQGTTYVNVTCRKAMAANAAASVHKGQPLLVTGRLWERHWTKEERSGRSLELQAEGLGHDLTYGTAEFARLVRAERRGGAPIDVSGLEVVDDHGGGADSDRSGRDAGDGRDRDGREGRDGRVEVVDGTEVMDARDHGVDHGVDGGVGSAENGAENNGSGPGRRRDLTATG
jgi:single-stranded DNA-binding protein